MNKTLNIKHYSLLLLYICVVVLALILFKTIGIPLAVGLSISLIFYVYEYKKDIALPAYISAVISGLLGALFFVIVFGTKIINPSHVQWLYDNADSVIKYVGWNFFRNEPWHFPPGLITDFGYPVPTSIMFTDAVPLVAVFLKLFSEYLPSQFQYLGVWMLFCYIMQGVSAAFLISKATNKISLQIMGSMFFILSPIMLFRGYLHHSLMVHWVLIGAFLLLFNKEKFPANKWIILISFTLLVHPYLFFMTFIVALVHLFMLYRIKKVSIPFVVKVFALMVAVIILLLWLIGFFVIRSDGSTSNFGMYAMNLNALFNPWAGYSNILKTRPWSIGHYEGFAYLGAGMLLLGVISSYIMIKNRKIVGFVFKSWYPLVIVCILFFLFAISNTIVFDEKVLLHIPIGEYLTGKAGIFRASGRFFWLPYYIMMFVILLIIVRKHRFSLSFLAVFTALFVQYYDFHSKFEETRRYFYTQPYEWDNPLKSKFWEYAADNYNKILFIPSDFNVWMPFANLASQNKMKINNGYFSRVDWSKWNEEQTKIINKIQAGQIDKDAIYIIKDEYLASLAQVKFDSEVKILKVDGSNVLVPIREGFNSNNFNGTVSNLAFVNLAPSFEDWSLSGSGTVISNSKIETIKSNLNYELIGYTLNVTPGKTYSISVDVDSDDTRGEGGVYIDIQDVLPDRSTIFRTGSANVLNGKTHLSYTVPENINQITIRIVVYKDVVGKFTLSNPTIYQIN